MNDTGYFIAPPVRPHFVSHFQYTGANRLFSEPECAALVALGDELGLHRAMVGNPDSSRLDEDYRAAAVALVPFQQRTRWIYERITARVQSANEHFAFDLTGLLEGLQLIRYDEPRVDGAKPGHYHWHQDFGGDYMARRKISVVAQLSEPTDYAGCRLTIMDPGPRELAETYLERGAGVIFPSWMPHAVTPITRGVRYALVAWVHGAPFR